jgi:hypothetical protein
MPSSDLIYTCGHGEFAKLILLNYTQWAADMAAILIIKDALEIVKGYGDMPVANQWTVAVDACSWKGKAYAILFMSCTPDVQNLIWGVIHPVAIWNMSKEKLDSAGSRARWAVLAQHIYTCLLQTNEKMTDFIATLQSCKLYLTTDSINLDTKCS